MVSYEPADVGSSVDPDKLAVRIANKLEQNSHIDDDVVENIRSSDTPLTEPVGFPRSYTGSLRSAVRYLVLTELKNEPEIHHVAFSKKYDERQVSITTHPSLLEKPNRLIHPPSLAKVYEYGYWPRGWNIVEGGRVPKSVDSVADTPHEQRKMGLVWKEEFYQKDFETIDRWFADAAAVRTFADHVTADSVSWAEYLPWYRTAPVSTYRLTRRARTTDWDEFPDRPDTRPEIEDRFDTSTNPRVGDFLRMAVLRGLERHLPSITNISTGPDAWTTDRVSMTVAPPPGEEHRYGGELCPVVAMKKLAEYGYRPIDGWYDAPTVGYESDDPVVPRRFEFARGQALRTWHEQTRLQSPMFEETTILREAGLFPELDWETLIPHVRSEIISYRDLHDLAQKSEGLF